MRDGGVAVGVVLTEEERELGAEVVGLGVEGWMMAEAGLTATACAAGRNEVIVPDCLGRR